MNLLAVSVGLAAVVITYYCLKVIYNLYFHPLANFPGPWWATTSYFPEFYYDVIKGGRYFAVILKMHEQYGPLVRFNPDELHLNDPHFYNTLYCASGPKQNKDKNHAVISGAKHSLNVTLDHDHHRKRRSYIANLFTRQATLRLESFIQGKVNKLVQKLCEENLNNDTLVGVQVFGALTTDVITHYAYGESFGELDKPDFPSPLTRDVKSLLLSCHFRRFLPVVAKIMQQLPESWMMWLNPAVITFFDLERKMTRLCIKERKRIRSQAKVTEERTIFDALTHSSVPPEEQTIERLRDESQLVLAAGVDTTSRILTAIVCYLCTYPEILSKIRTELQPVWDRHGAQPTWSQLESVSYLTAIINEALRNQCVMTTHFPRVPQQPLKYKDWVIPAGTSVGARPWILNRHPDIFPEPDTFRPERWLEAEARGEHLTRYLTTFTKGSRMCLGINLAYAELYLTTAALVRNFNFELVDSSIKNITMYRDYALSFDKDYNYGVKFRITKVLQEELPMASV